MLRNARAAPKAKLLKISNYDNGKGTG